MSEVTRLLDAAAAGDRRAAGDLLPLVYEELRKLAAARMAIESPDQTLQPTALVHEAYLRLVDHAHAEVRDRASFFGAAARAMRRVLVDHARRHRAARRGGARARPISLEALEATDSATLATGDRAEILLALDEALDRLAALDERQARVVECRFFGGLTAEETAAVLGVTTRTVERDWMKARGWLYRALRDDAD
jgi:RNA polymerase sigma factor (TIGR02999 family)